MNEAKKQKMQDIQEAVKLYQHAGELIEEAIRLIERNVDGLRLMYKMPERGADWDYKEYRNKFQVHVYEGLHNLAEVFDETPEKELTWNGKENDDTKVFVIDEIKFYQLGDKTESGKYEYR